MNLQLASHQELCRHFALLLSYPQAATGDFARTCRSLLSRQDPSAAAAVERFCSFVEVGPASRVEEVYTATFDLQPLCSPYVGYQLFGESKQRAMFLVKIQEMLRHHGLVSEGELPDHLSEVLRLLATVPEAEMRSELVHDALLPALAAMLKGIDGEANPYGDLLRALEGFLSGEPAMAAVDSAALKRS